MNKSAHIALVSLVMASCSTPQKQETAMNYPQDPHSFATPNRAVVEHLDLDLSVNFESKKLAGTATWTIAHAGADTLVLDTYGLSIASVQLDGSAAENYSLDPHHPIFGQALRIPLQENTQKVAISYSTGADAKALQWLAPEQTAGKQFPFLFTQSQAILARTWIPCQDSPGIRFTYSAKIQAPTNLLALMSATNPTEKSADGRYHFEMKQPIPSYLMALAVGNITFKAVDNRTGVYAEPELLDTAHWEFQDMNNMVATAEALYGPYAWDRYDLLVLPPSFPFGGMENPRLTFATPTILAGDRSLVSLVAHELAHSWSGNLVTNATWNDFWLNEGFTVYFEQRIMEALYGRDYSEMLASLSKAGLVEEVADFMETKPEDTRLKLDLTGRNPDDGVTSIAYDKGYFFLRLVEETVGREKFDAFLKNYFGKNKFKVMDTDRFEALLKDSLLSQEQWTSIGVDQWIHGSGLPDNCPTPTASRFTALDEAIAAYGFFTVPDSISQSWSTHEWIYFINQLPQEISADELSKMDQRYHLTESGNSEILAAWFQPVIRSNYLPAYQKMEAFLVSVGRRKFLTPTYKTLVATNQMELAQSIYAKARPNYHAVARETMDHLLLENTQ